MVKQTTGKSQPKTKAASLDPICGRRLMDEPADLSTEYKKRRYYFCSAQCRDAFHTRTERFRMVDLARAGSLLTPGRMRWGVG